MTAQAIITLIIGIIAAVLAAIALYRTYNIRAEDIKVD
jgi:hypothetical protein